MSSPMKVPLITNIQRYSFDDGPGIRTVVFLKGCLLRCPWCHNPENKSTKMGLYFYASKCARCGRCAEICPEQAISFTGTGQSLPRRERGKCSQCMQCVSVCPTGALEQVGESLTMAEIVREAISDIPFFKNSGGGVTISGGEPLLFPEFTLELVRELKQQEVHVALETCGFCQWEHLKQVAEYVDLFFYDLKHINLLKHQTTVGVPNDVIHDNLRQLVSLGAKVIIRVPVIPGFNNDQHNFKMLADFIASLEHPVQGVDLLPFHNFGEAKYQQLDENYAYQGVANMEKEEVAELVEILQKTVKTTVGGVALQ